jgi:hypothetical protein
MSTKRVDVLVHGGDRQLFSGPGLRCSVIDIFKRQRRLVDALPVSPLFKLNLDLPFDGPQVYGLLVEADGHRPGWHLIAHDDFVRLDGDRRVERDDALLRVLLVPERSQPLDLPAAYARLVKRRSPFAFERDEDARAILEQENPAAAMAYFNIEAKLRETDIDGRPLLSLVTAIERVDVDRVILLMRSTAKALVAASPQFSRQPGHPPLHTHSWKHRTFPAGNVQLSFSEKVVDRPGVVDCHSVDVDIDLAKGVGHAFEWLRNNVFERGHKTDQASVFALLFDQNILPEYTLAPSVARAAAPRPRALPPPAARAAVKRAAKKRTAKRKVAKKGPRKGRRTKATRATSAGRRR